MFQQWREVVGEAGDFRKLGFVRIVHPDESQCLKLNLEMQRRLGVNVQMPGREDLREIEPDWVLDDVEFAAYEPDSGYGDGAGVANDFLGRARDMGVTYLPRTRASNFRLEHEHIRGVSTDPG
jgi:glycine/D-amino acid oxidase-like deaminating enzyme